MKYGVLHRAEVDQHRPLAERRRHVEVVAITTKSTVAVRTSYVYSSLQRVMAEEGAFVALRPDGLDRLAVTVNINEGQTKAGRSNHRLRVHTSTYILQMGTKPIIWVGNSLDDLRNFPERARTVAGYNLRLLQNGLMPNDWRPMSSIGAGVAEIRIQTGRQHRVFYIARFDAGIYVLHAFEKKTQRTSKRDLDMGKKRLLEILRSRSKG